MADENVYHIKFPGNVILEVQLQKPHPVNLTVKFANGSGVNFSYSPEGVGKADSFGSVVQERGTSDFENRVRPVAIPAGSATGIPGNAIAIEYDDPGGSRM
jgi:hypothetical protein